jgi:transposase
MVRLIESLAEDWRRLDERIDQLSGEIAALARQDAGCERLMSVPGIGPIISSAMVAAIGAGEVFSKGPRLRGLAGPGESLRHPSAEAFFVASLFFGSPGSANASMNFA